MRIGTRRSALALAQARLVADLLGDCEIVPMLTSGDRAQVRSEDKSRWVRELESALLRGEIDLAVHSAKDVPARLADGLSLLGAPPRGAAEDVLCGARSLEDLAEGSRVGTSSVRRLAQLRSAREDIEVVPIRGNVDTRLRKLATGAGLQALVLAAAGLRRLGRQSEVGTVLDPERFVPAPGQGVLALEGRTDDARIRAEIEKISDAATVACLFAERALAHELSATCNAPLGAHATSEDGGGLWLRAWVGLPDGSAWLSDELSGASNDPSALGRRVAERLQATGGGELLERAEEMAGVGSER
jgi:hydroxymethylbilane synthase